jgi:uncharacterized protein (UPF0335 family)
MNMPLDNKNQLLSFIERVERLEEEKKAQAEDIKEVLNEAKSSGFEPKYIRKIVALRKQDPDKRRQEEQEFELYKEAVGLND